MDLTNVKKSVHHRTASGKYMQILKMKILAVLFIFSFVAVILCGKRKAQGKVKYEMNWNDKFATCDGEVHLLDLGNLKIEKDSATSTVLSGSFDFLGPIHPGTSANIIVEKETPQGKVLFLTLEVTDICDHVSEENMPWTLFFDAMNLDPKQCPLPAATYPLNELKLNMSFADKMMTKENVAEYMARIELDHAGDGLDVVQHTVACMLMGFSVQEVREEAE